MNADQMIADLVNILESENAEAGWAQTIASYLAAAGLERLSDAAEHLPALQALEQRRRVDLESTLAQILDPSDDRTPARASDLLGKANSSWFGRPTAGVSRLRIALIKLLFEHGLEGSTAEVEAIPAGYSCVPQTVLYLAGDYVDDPRALELLPRVFTAITTRWAGEEHVADLIDGRYAGQLDTWKAQLKRPRAEIEAAWAARTADWAASGSSLALVLSREAALDLFANLADG